MVSPKGPADSIRCVAGAIGAFVRSKMYLRFDSNDASSVVGLRIYDAARF